MPIATTTQAGRETITPEAKAIMNNATADRAARMQAAKEARDASTRELAAQRARDAADTLTPLFPEPTIGKAPLATVPAPPAAPEPAKAARTFSVSTVVAYRGRTITIQASGMTLDQFCDLMDDRGYAAPAPLAIADPTGWQTLPDGTPICPRHGAPMRKRERQGDTWFSHNAGTKDAPLYCKGYRGPDSPGYEVD